MKKIFVTGAGGWLGSAIVRALLERGDDVLGTDMRISPAVTELQNQYSTLHFREADLCDGAKISDMMQSYQPDAVIHCAAIVGVILAADAGATAIRVNVEGTLNVLEAMRRANVKRAVHISTEETYGDFQKSIISEDHPQRPVSAYGLTKLAAEHYGHVYAREYGLEFINVRTCWVYGPNFPRPRMPKTYIDAALKGEAMVIESGGDFAVDQVYISDTIAGVLLALDKKAHRYDSYNIATGAAPTLADIISIINNAVPGSCLQIRDGTYKHGDRFLTARKGALDITRARIELGYVPAFDIKRGIEEMIRLTKKELATT